MLITAAAPTAPSTPGTAPLPPLQDRTPEQLRDGMLVTVKGAGSEDVAVARLVQDGAQYMARSAGTTMGLGTVEVNYGAADRQGALGLATFQGTSGWFALSKRSTLGILEGIKRLRSTPWAEWTEAQRQDFVQANETILHESAHVTLDGYSSAQVGAWRSANRDIEEGISEVAAMAHIASFMREEFGIDTTGLTDRITQSTSAYTRFSERLRRLLAMGTDGTSDAVAAAASVISDGVRADRREAEIAARIGANLAGANAPAALVAEIERTIPGFIAEKNGTRTKLMELQAALVDAAAGRLTAAPEAVAADIRARYEGLDTPETIPVTGTAPLA